MSGQRLKQLRLARGFSMDGLVAAMGGMVTKQALSKYERDLIQPSQAVLRCLARSLDVSIGRLAGADAIEIQIRAYRKKARLGKKEMERIENFAVVSLQDRLRLEDALGLSHGSGGAIQQIGVGAVEDAEAAAESVRREWGLGDDPIACVIDTLEDHHIHVVEVDASDAFDGISAVAVGGRGRLVGGAVVIREGLPGERQRLDLTHELGHLVLDLSDGTDEEKAAFRFGAAMLAPAEAIRRDVGTRRRYVDLQELLLLKRRYGMSVQALLYRLRDLQVITEAQYKAACIQISQLGWRRQEPMELEPEKPTWLRQNVLRAVSEGVLSTREGGQIMGEELEQSPALSLIERRALMAMPVEERQRVLQAQAERLAQDYEPDPDWAAIDGEDFIGA